MNGETVAVRQALYQCPPAASWQRSLAQYPGRRPMSTYLVLAVLALIWIGLRDSR